MISHAFATTGIGAPYRGRVVELDLDGLPDGVTAIIGGNGAGKSTFLDLLVPGALYGELPHDRDPQGAKGAALVDFVHPDERAAFVEHTFSLGGARYRIRRNVDGKRRKTEAFLWRDGDETPIAGPLVSDVAAALARIIPSRPLLLAGPFACQGGHDSFSRVPQAQRRALVMEMMGAAHWQRLAEAAADEEKRALADLEAARVALVDVAARVERANAIATTLEALAPTLEAQTAAAETARQVEAEARATLDLCRGDLARLEAEAAAASRERERLDGERDAAAGRVAGLRQQLATIDATLADAAAVDAAVAALDDIDARLPAERDAAAAASDALRAAEAQRGERAARLDAMRATHAGLARELDAAEAAARAVALADAALATLDLDAEAAVTAEVEDAENRRPTLEDAARAEAEANATRARLEARAGEIRPATGLLDRIPGAPECSGCPLTAHARTARETLAAIEAELADVPAQSTAAAAALAAHDARTRALAATRERARAWRAAVDGVRVDDGTRALAATAVRLAEEAVTSTANGLRLRREVEQLDLDVAAIGERAAAAAARVRDIETRRAEVARVAAPVAAVAAARADRATTATALAEAEATLETYSAIGLPPMPDVVGARAVVARAEAALAATEAAAQEAARALAVGVAQRERLIGERDGLGDVVTQAAELRAREAAAVTEAADWAVLKRACGRTGVPALLIELFGPEITTIANDLIATHFTPRFQVALTTQVPTADGKGVRDVFEPRLIDAEAGREGTRGSGGETTLVDTALRLAMAIVNTRRSGIAWETLAFDEPTGALSADNAPRFLEMIRAAQRLGGFRRALVITHDPLVWEAADARLIVEAGSVRVWAPAAREAA